MGWAANPSRKQESMFSLAIIQMGARVYLPSLGRFLQVDPVEGGTANAYVYALDPINQSDYSGQSLFGALVTVVRAISQIATTQSSNKYVAAVQKAVAPLISPVVGAVQSITTVTAKPSASKPPVATVVSSIRPQNTFDFGKLPKVQSPVNSMTKGASGYDVYNQASNTAGLMYAFSIAGGLAGGAVGCIGGGAAGALGMNPLSVGAGCIWGGAVGSEWGSTLGAGYGLQAGYNNQSIPLLDAVEEPYPGTIPWKY